MRQDIAFVRHGAYWQRSETPSAWQPFPLTAEGEQQAVAGAAMIAGYCREMDLRPAATIFCSELLRARQTADIIAEQLAEPGEPCGVHEHGGLNERSVGSLANLTVAEIEQVLRDDPRHGEAPTGWKSDSAYRLPYPGAESLLQAGERVARLVRLAVEIQLEACGPGRLLIFVGHGAAIRHAAYHLGILSLDEVRSLSMHHATPVFCRHQAGDRWRHVAGEWKSRSPRTLFMD